MAGAVVEVQAQLMQAEVQEAELDMVLAEVPPDMQIL
jgi:hypothetical protein